MASFTGSEDLSGAEFTGVDLRGARFREANLAGVVMRGVEVAGADIDAPWLAHGSLLVNGVDVAPLVDAELDRRFPGRSERRATDPDGLRSAYDKVQAAWAATLDRVAAMPPGTVDVSVAGEWSFVETVRHLVMATDVWLGRAILRLDQPFHPLGLAFEGAEDEDLDLSVFATTVPSYDDVLEARAGRVAMVREFLATVSTAELDEPRVNPWGSDRPESVRSCLHVILEEEWEHHRFAVRDLDTL